MNFKMVIVSITCICIYSHGFDDSLENSANVKEGDEQTMSKSENSEQESSFKDDSTQLIKINQNSESKNKIAPNDNESSDKHPIRPIGLTIVSSGIITIGAVGTIAGPIIINNDSHAIEEIFRNILGSVILMVGIVGDVVGVITFGFTISEWKEYRDWKVREDNRTEISLKYNF